MKNDVEFLFPSMRPRLWASTAGVFIAAVVMTAAAPVYLPFDQATTVILPIFFFPVTWLVLFLWAFMSPRVKRVWLILSVLTFLNVFLIVFALAQGWPGSA